MPYQLRLPNCGLFSRSSTSPSAGLAASSRAGRRHSTRSVPGTSATVASAPTVSTWYDTRIAEPASSTLKIAPETSTLVRESSRPCGSE